MTAQLTDVRCNSESATLTLVWADAFCAVLPHALLRRNCACAECKQLRRRGHPPRSEGITVNAIVPFGPNAIQLQFSDGHTRGIFPFQYLRELADAFRSQVAARA